MEPDHVVHVIICVNENNFSVCGFETFLTGNKSSDKNLMFLVKKKTICLALDIAIMYFI